ncbi:unnamed protein product [Caenorhabditis brenneri]
MRLWILISLFLSSTLAITLAIIVGRDGGGFHGYSSPSESSSSEEHGHGNGHGHGHGHGQGHGHGHGHGHGNSHGPRPKPPRPPRPAPRNECDDGWMRFERPNGIWCIHLGNPGVTNGAFSHQDAQNACAALGATLTGYQNENERMTVANEALKKTIDMGRLVAGIWLGAVAYPNCRVTSCGPYATFQWTDGNTNGAGGIKWGIGEPDNVNWPGTSACIQQFVMSPNFMAGPEDHSGWKTSFANGDLDKYQCTSLAHPRTRLYACGKRGVSR